MMKRVVLCGFVSISCLLTACASAPIVNVKDADEKMVAGCQFLGNVSGGSMMGGAMQHRARERARNAVRNDAAELGATHVVWSGTQSNFNGASAEAKAYRCQ